jgi:uncharacterized protein YndB with AHSA1/START domain
MVGVHVAGTYTHIVPNQLIEYSFGGREARVDFEDTPDGVRVTVTFDAEDTFPVDQQRAGWQAILDNFRRYAEGPAATDRHL